MKEIKVNDYIRTVDGIKKVIAINTGTRVTIYGKYVLDKDYKGIRPAIAEKNILKHSKNIIDLIEVGDYVNGCRVAVDWVKTELIINQYDEGWKSLKDIEIKSIVTHEIFNSIKYEVRDEHI